MAAVIDLKPDRDLLDPCFETYRLESKPLEVEAIKLQVITSNLEEDGNSMDAPGYLW